MINITHTISTYCVPVSDPTTGSSGIDIVDNLAVATECNWVTGSAASEWVTGSAASEWVTGLVASEWVTGSAASEWVTGSAASEC